MFSTSTEHERDEAIRKVQFLERTLEEERAERKAEYVAKWDQREAKHKAYKQYIMENYCNQPQVYISLSRIHPYFLNLYLF